MQLSPPFMLLLSSFYAHNHLSFDIFHSFFPTLKMQPQSRSFKETPSIIRTAESIAKSFGYECQTHAVTTEDGYIIVLHRILKPSRFYNYPKKSSPILLLPGFMASSDTWLFRGKDKDLPYLFADAGYEMWIYNPRGNVYSRNHVNLDPDVHKEYWNFSFHEMGIYDLPAAIDYILNKTNQDTVTLIGHSMGTTVSMVTCAEKPEYNKKIKLNIALAPAVTVNTKLLNMFSRFLLTIAPIFANFMKGRNSYELLPQRRINGQLAEFLCGDKSQTQKTCLEAMFEILGKDYEQLNTTMIPTAFSYYPSGTSLGTLMHMWEVFNGKFVSTYKYKNGFVGKQTVKPYDLSKITTPVAIYYGRGDQMIHKMDLKRLKSKLSNVVGLFEVPHPNFNHLDFMWATNASHLLYKDLLKLTHKYR